MHCNVGAEWARVSCKTLSKVQGGELGMGKIILAQKMQKRLNKITSYVCSWLDSTTKVYQGGNKTQGTRKEPREYSIPQYFR